MDSSEDDSRTREDRGQALNRVAELNRDPRLLDVARKLRGALPGDAELGDSISRRAERKRLIDRPIAALADADASLLREAGLGAVQLLDSLRGSSSQVKGLAIAFTDLAGFSAFALDAGDDATLGLLREVGEAIEPPVRAAGGEVVKRMGDGMMAIFSEPEQGIAALIEAQRRVGELEVAVGYRPEIRAGLHFGSPKRLGGDFLGRDVNIAARVADHAGAGQLLITGEALSELGEGATIDVKRKRRFKAKGVPRETEVFCVETFEASR